MAAIGSISAAVQNVQQVVLREMSIKILRQAAPAEQALADILAQQARALAELQSSCRPNSAGIPPQYFVNCSPVILSSCACREI